MITADVSTTTGPCTSISPFTAPAITADVAVMLPIMTDPKPILTVPELTTSPSTFAESAKNSADELFPITDPVTVNLPLHFRSPSILPLISKHIMCSLIHFHILAKVFGWILKIRHNIRLQVMLNVQYLEEAVHGNYIVEILSLS